jgi:hypothetical protein
VVLGTTVEEGDGDGVLGADGVELAAGLLASGLDLASSVFASSAHPDVAKTAVSASTLAPRRTAWLFTTILSSRYSGGLKIAGD